MGGASWNAVGGERDRDPKDIAEVWILPLLKPTQSTLPFILASHLTCCIHLTSQSSHSQLHILSDWLFPRLNILNVSDI